MDWRLLQRAAFGIVGVLPGSFWSLTPPEWAAVLQARYGGVEESSLGREEYEHLKKAVIGHL
ncbi:MAG: phage tail assembly chaperone [Holosporales bacterium]